MLAGMPGGSDRSGNGATSLTAARSRAHSVTPHRKMTITVKIAPSPYPPKTASFHKNPWSDSDLAPRLSRYTDPAAFQASPASLHFNPEEPELIDASLALAICWLLAPPLPRRSERLLRQGGVIVQASSVLSRPKLPLLIWQPLSRPHGSAFFAVTVTPSLRGAKVA